MYANIATKYFFMDNHLLIKYKYGLYLIFKYKNNNEYVKYLSFFRFHIHFNFILLECNDETFL